MILFLWDRLRSFWTKIGDLFVIKEYIISFSYINIHLYILVFYMV